jgi:plastocyanin
MTLGAALLLTVAGCGGKGTETDSAVVVPDPTVAASSAPAGGASHSAGATAASTEKKAEATAAAPTAAAPTAAAPTAAVKSEGFGTLKGKILFDGDAPAAKTLVTKGDSKVKDSAVCAVGDIKSERLVVDSASKGVKNVIVFIAKPTAVDPAAKAAKATTKVVFDQNKCVFEPHVLVMLANTEVELSSTDDVSHNVRSAVQNNSFNDLLSPRGKSKTPKTAAARQPGLVSCDIHPWMTSYWLVLDHPYFAVTDAQGNFEIKGAPAGTQKVVVWQEATGFVTPASGQDVTIAANGDTAQEFKIKAAQVKPEQ